MKPLRKAGVREVKAQLSELLHRVQGGETVLITSRGRVVAELRPPSAVVKPKMTDDQRAIAELIAEGKLIPPKNPTGKFPPPPELNLPKGLWRKYYDEDREDRF